MTISSKTLPKCSSCVYCSLPGPSARFTTEKVKLMLPLTLKTPACQRLPHASTLNVLHSTTVAAGNVQRSRTVIYLTAYFDKTKWKAGHA